MSYLFVGEDKKHRISELVFGQHSHEFLSSLADTLSVVGVDHKDQSLRVLEVMPPQWSDLVLSADVPHSETNIFIFNCLDVETC